MIEPAATGARPSRMGLPALRLLATAIVAAALLAALLVALGAQPATERAPSFDCTIAHAAAKTICTEPALAALDTDIAAAYAAALSRLDAAGRAALRADQRAWHTDRDVATRAALST